MTASPVVKSLCRGAEMKEASHQTAMLVALTTACLSADALMQLLEQKRDRVNSALSSLLGRGLAERREKGCFTATKAGLNLIAEHGFVPRAARNFKAKAPKRRSGTVRQRAWNVMRIKSPFTMESVSALVATGAAQRAQSLPDWFLALERAGYIRREVRRRACGPQGGQTSVRYWLTKNTGMLAPVLSAKYGIIRDPNTGVDTPCTK